MRKFYLLLFIVCFSTLPFKVFGENNGYANMDSLNVKIESLSHDLDYLTLTYEIYVMNTDLRFFNIEIKDQINSIRIDLYHHDFDRDMYRSYKKVYNGFRENLDSSKNLIDVKRKFYLAKVQTCDLTKLEEDILSNSFEVTDKLYKRAEISLDGMKSALDLYYKSM
ncbi:MAG: hypothetical protein NC212_02180 [Staphylococcus sp.]|nr:hypothetical protein [Staphylococcus sp.]